MTSVEGSYNSMHLYLVSACSNLRTD